MLHFSFENAKVTSLWLESLNLTSMTTVSFLFIYLKHFYPVLFLKIKINESKAHNIKNKLFESEKTMHYYNIEKY